MGTVGMPEIAILFVGMLYADTVVLHSVQTILEETYGAVLLETPASQWEQSRYYEQELGWPLFRKFVFYRRIIHPEDLADIKTKTNEMEGSFSVDGNRRINLDPGYLTLSKIVLASTKNYAHRIYLRNGIYGEVTLYYKHGTFRPHLFTYQDYQKQDCLDMFMQARKLLAEQINNPSM